MIRGVRRVVVQQANEDAASQPAPLAAGQREHDAQKFRVVHTSGEMIVSTIAEAKALMSKLPGARVFCAFALT